MNLRRCCARQPLLRHDPTFRTDRLASDLNPRTLNGGRRPVRGQARWWSSAPQPRRPSAPQCSAVRGKGSRRRRLIATSIRSGARVDAASERIAARCRKPHTGMRTGWTGLRVEEGASGRSQGRKQHVFSKGSVKCEKRHVAANLGFLGGVHPQRPAHRRRERVQPSSVSWHAASAQRSFIGWIPGRQASAGCLLQVQGTCSVCVALRLFNPARSTSWMRVTRSCVLHRSTTPLRWSRHCAAMFQRPAISDTKTNSFCRPPLASTGYVPCLCRSATFNPALSTSWIRVTCLCVLHRSTTLLSLCRKRRGRSAGSRVLVRLQRAWVSQCMPLL